MDDNRQLGPAKTTGSVRIEQTLGFQAIYILSLPEERAYLFRVLCPPKGICYRTFLLSIRVVVGGRIIKVRRPGYAGEKLMKPKALIPSPDSKTASNQL